MKHITPQELNEKHLRGEHFALIDVRTPAEFRAVHVPFALNLPLDTLSADGVRELARDLPVYLICRSGMRAQNACSQLMVAGFEGLTLVQGGTDGWRSAGLDVELGKSAISLDNQVRLIAGGLVLDRCRLDGGRLLDGGRILGLLASQHPPSLVASGEAERRWASRGGRRGPETRVYATAVKPGCT